MSRLVSGSARTLGLLVLTAAVLTAAAPSVLRIKPGDTLSGLAQRHHTTVAKLQQANHLRGTTIYAGELLTIPGNATPPTGPVAASRHAVTRVYTVRSGDNLTLLAKRFHTTPSALKSSNKLRRSTLLIGQHLAYRTVVVTAGTPAVSKRSAAVSRSATAHRRQLSSMRLPSKAAVQRLIRASAKRHGVPESLALATAYQESGFQMRVVSPVDAIGAMQVLPSTARTLGHLHGRTFDLLKASDNVDAGVILLKDLLNATGSPASALAGYYQGLGSVSRVGLLPQTHAYIKNITLMRARFA
jgi:LysM repeat protein